MTTFPIQDTSADMPGIAADKPESASDKPEPPADAAVPPSAADMVATTTETSTDPPDTSRHLDVEALVAWMIVGFRLFSVQRSPSLAEVRREAECAAMVIAMPRCGSITQAADHLRTSRRALRDKLKAAGLYPWTDDQAAPYRIDLGPA